MVLSDGPQPCRVLENLLVVCQDDLTAALAELDGMALSSSWDACTGLFFGVILGCLFGCLFFLQCLAVLPIVPWSFGRRPPSGFGDPFMELSPERCLGQLMARARLC